MKEVIIIGGGPAGLMAAYQLKRAHIDYLLLEKNPVIGKKLLITGQGRCNVTNHMNNNQFIASLTIPHRKFLFSALSNFNTSNIVDFFEEHNVPLYQDGDLKYFPKSNKAIDILNVFKREIEQEVIYNQTVLKIIKDNFFTIKTNDATYQAKRVIIATGSRSYPKTGSSGDVRKFVDSFSVDFIPFYPAETAVYSSYIARNTDFLQGVSLNDVTVKIKGTKIEKTDDILFTHFGLSGPVIFYLSEFIYKDLKDNKTTLQINFTKMTKEELSIKLGNESYNLFIAKFLELFITKRLARFIIQRNKLDNIKIGSLTSKQKEDILSDLTQFEVTIDRVEDTEKAFVNGGGVSVKEVNPKTFELKKVSGLYVIGEALDIHGPIGGYNITMALSSGYSVAKCIKEEINA